MDSTPTEQVNPFRKRPHTWPHLSESIVFWLFRLATYFILLCGGLILGVIAWHGSKTVFSTEFPFVNVPFFTQAPETLHVFHYEGQKFELADSAFRVWCEENSIDAGNFRTETYSYSGGGIMPAIVGTLLLILGSMTIALGLGILSAIFLSEYSRDSKFIRVVRLSILNLAGVPSIVFGLFGFGLFVLYLDWGVSLAAGWFTLAFMVLPIIITASEEALRSVPPGFREGSLALGATKWQTVRTNVLPYALPGILTSSILGVTRVAGETAPIMFTAAYAIRDQLPWEVSKWSDFFTQGVMALPYHIYVVSAKIPQNEYTQRMQYGTAFVFLLLVALIALVSIILRNKVRGKYRW